MFKLLVHRIYNNGVHFDDEKFKAINEAPFTTNKNALRGFLGIGEYRPRFTKPFACISTDPHACLYGNWKLEFADEITMAFETLKERVTSPPLVGFPDFEPPLFCKRTLRVSLLKLFSRKKKEISKIHPVKYAIRTAGRNNSAYKREALVVIFALRMFRVYFP